LIIGDKFIILKKLIVEDLDHILSHTKNLWDELRGKKIFMTGGTGFFGTWLLESFLWANMKFDLGAEIILFSRDPDRFMKKVPHLLPHVSVKIIHGDVKKEIPYVQGPIHYIIHAATEYDAQLGATNPLSNVDTIITGTRKVLDFANTQSSKRFLFISSGAVYGKQLPTLENISENFPGAPDVTNVDGSYMAYGEAKRMAESLCSMYRKTFGLNTVIARCFSFIGPYLDLSRHYAISSFINDGLLGRPIHVEGDGRDIRSYLYAADLAIWLWTLLIKGRSGQVYNVGSEQAITVGNLAYAVSLCFQPPRQVIVAKKEDVDKPVDRYVPSIARAHSELGLEEWINLKEALKKTIDWNRNKRAG